MHLTAAKYKNDLIELSYNSFPLVAELRSRAQCPIRLLVNERIHRRWQLSSLSCQNVWWSGSWKHQKKANELEDQVDNNTYFLCRSWIFKNAYKCRMYICNIVPHSYFFPLTAIRREHCQLDQVETSRVS